MCVCGHVSSVVRKAVIIMDPFGDTVSCRADSTTGSPSTNKPVKPVGKPLPPASGAPPATEGGPDVAKQSEQAAKRPISEVDPD